MGIRKARILLSGIVCLVLAAASQGGTLYVDADATGLNDGSNWSDAFVELQSALAIAQPGDDVWVAQGIYTPDYDVESGTHTLDPTLSFVLRSGVGVYGGFAGNEAALSQRDVAGNPTVLSGDLLADDDTRGNDENSTSVVDTSSADRSGIIDGFVVTAGRGFGGAGGGIHNLGGSPTIAGCHIVENEGGGFGNGAGMYNGVGANPLIVDSVFDTNEDHGIFCEYAHLHMIGCRIVNNRALFGAGIHARFSRVLLERCEVSENLAWHGFIGGGGGIWSQQSNVVLEGCVFFNNLGANGGGAILHSGLDMVMNNCTVAGNVSATSNSSYGGGIVVASGNIVITNSILWGNSDLDGLVESSQLMGVGIDVTHSCIQGLDTFAKQPGVTGTDPLLVDLAAGDASLAPTSPCIDAGDSTAWCHMRDIADRPRGVDTPDVIDTGSGPHPTVDMGALEFMPSDCNDNGVPDARDIAMGAPDVNADGIPDECEPSGLDCNLNGFVDACFLEHRIESSSPLFEFTAGQALTHTMGPVPPPNGDVRIRVVATRRAGPTTVSINGTPVGDVFQNSLPCDQFEKLDESVFVPESTFNTLVPTGDLEVGLEVSTLIVGKCFSDPLISATVIYQAQGDCNGSGVLDACDIDAGTSTDCDANSRPDECDSQIDCNNNGMFDGCDALADPSLDLNGNLLIDDCEPCTTFADCADLDGDGIRDNNCVHWQCLDGFCRGFEIIHGDMGGQFGSCLVDGTADGNDRFMALGCFGSVWPSQPCEDNPPFALNVDAGGRFGACAPDGVCDANDAFHALNVFGGVNTCSCPLDGGPSPSFEPRTKIVDSAVLSLRSSMLAINAGESLRVDVYLDTPLADLRGYQLHANTAGGFHGHLILVDIVIEQVATSSWEKAIHTSDQRLATSPSTSLRAGDQRAATGARREARSAQRLASTKTPASPESESESETGEFSSYWSAFNVEIAQMLAGTDGPGVPTESNTYLATFIFQASADARGEFMIELLADHNDPAHRTFLFATDPTDVIAIEPREPVIVDVNP